MAIHLDHLLVPSRHKAADMQFNTQHGGAHRLLERADGRQWELLTISYARQAN